MEHPKYILSCFDSVVNGVLRPQNYNDDLKPLKLSSQASVKRLSNTNDLIDYLTELFRDDEIIHISEDQAKWEDIQLEVSEIPDSYKQIISDVKIAPVFNNKTAFFYDFLKAACAITCSRIEKQFSKLSTPELKRIFSDRIILFIRNLFSNIVERDPDYKYNDASSNDWIANAIRQYLISLLVFVGEKFDGFCTIRNMKLLDWEFELDPQLFFNTDYSYLYYSGKTRDVKIVKKTIDEISEDELIALFENNFNILQFDDYDYDYISRRVSGRLTLKEWIAFKDPNGCYYSSNLSDYPIVQINEIIANEHAMFNEFVEILLNHKFVRIFEKIDALYKIVAAKNDLMVINSLVTNSKVDKNIITQFQTSYNFQISDKLSKDVGAVMYNLTFETTGYKLLSFAPAAAILKYKDFLTVYLADNEKAEITNTNRKQKKSKNPPQINLNSFIYIYFDTNTSALTDLKNSLEDDGYIKRQTPATDFKNAFCNHKPDNKIHWIAGITSLYTFISILCYDKKLVKFHAHYIWKLTCNIFIDENGQEFEFRKFRSEHRLKDCSKLLKAIKLIEK